MGVKTQEIRKVGGFTYFLKISPRLFGEHITFWSHIFSVGLKPKPPRVISIESTEAEVVQQQQQQISCTSAMLVSSISQICAVRNGSIQLKH